MKAKLLLSSIAFVITSNITIAKAQAINVNDSLALVDFYNSTKGPHWTNHTNWLQGPVSTWYGVTTEGSRVVSMYMERNNVSGPLPSSFGNLTALSTFYLVFNHLSGQLPEAIGNLAAITDLNLSFNELTGGIPSSIGNLTNLLNLNLYYNRLSNPLPATLGDLASLKTLSVGFNFDISGAIPSSLGKLTQLTYLDLSGNAFTGKLPDSLGNLAMLQYFTVQGNQLSGHIPQSFGKLNNLTYLQLDENHFSGTIPASLGNDTLLTQLSLNSNNLTGNIPKSLLQLKHLTMLSVMRNHLSAKRNVHLDTTITTTEVYVNENDYTFTGLESMAKSITQFYCALQAPVKVHQHDGYLAVSPGGTLSKVVCYWQKVGAPAPYIVIKGDTTFHPTESGRYWVKINDTKIKGLTLKTDTINYVMPTTLHSIVTGGISVYPNPVQSTLTISGLDAKSRSKIVVSGYTGIVWLSTVAVQQSAVKYDVSRLKPGNYIITITSSNNISTVKFMKE